jgi:hypothetical protein
LGHFHASFVITLPPSISWRSASFRTVAPALGIALTDHDTVLARARHAVAKIEARIAWAQRSGVLHEFNQEYRRRRLKRQARGERFMGYAQAPARLRRAIAKVATSGTATAAFVREVFGDVAFPLTPELAGR